MVGAVVGRILFYYCMRILFCFFTLKTIALPIKFNWFDSVVDERLRVDWSTADGCGY